LRSGRAGQRASGRAGLVASGGMFQRCMREAAFLRFRNPTARSSGRRAGGLHSASGCGRGRGWRRSVPVSCSA
jgi:hypothetical protein